jgi:hypothetical protein
LPIAGRPSGQEKAEIRAATPDPMLTETHLLYAWGRFRNPTIAIQTQVDLSSLDRIIEEVVNDPAESECNHLKENLERARDYQIGAMPQECLPSMQLAKMRVDCVSDDNRRRRISEMIGKLLTA